MGETKLCPGCMEPNHSADPCPNCGYVEGTPNPPDYMQPGTVLHERYEVGAVLGYNGEGATYLAYDTVICCKVLIREFMPAALCTRVKGTPTISVQYNNLAQYKALMAEFTELNKSLARMRTLSHINPALDLLAENNTTYTVFEYIEGLKLIDYLKDNAGELTWNQVKAMFPPLFTTLSLIHNAGVLHRGISPETIYVTEKGSLLLSAFCISSVRTANAELEAEMFQGYAAPEQYSSAASSRQGTWTDVYGICAVLYRILAGCMPTSATSRLDNDNLCAPHELNPGVPEQVSRTLMQGLDLNANNRIQTITELVTKLFESKEETGRMQIPPVSQPLPERVPVAHPAPAFEPRPQTPKSVASAPKTAPVPKKEHFDAYSDLESAASGSVIDRIKVPVIIGVLAIAVITIIIVVLIQMFNSSDSEKIDSNAGSSSSSENVIPVSSSESDSVTYNSEMCNLVGYYFEAKKAEFAHWFTLVGEEVYDDNAEVGVIIEQDPKPGELFNAGSEVKVKVSLGPATVKVPEFKNMKLSAYTAELDKLSLKYKTLPSEWSKAEAGYVVKTSVEPGETIDRREEYTLTVYYAKGIGTTAATTTGDTTHTTVAPATTTAPSAPGTDAPPIQITLPVEGGEGLPGIEQHD